MFTVPPDARSWVQVPEDSHFPIQNLPFGRVVTGGEYQEAFRIGDFVVLPRRFRGAPGLEAAQQAYQAFVASEYDPTNGVVETLRELRRQVANLMHIRNGHLMDHPAREEWLVHIADVEPWLPMNPRAYVDFYSGIHHASNVGKMFRPDQPPLLPNYRHVPIGYNGRASSVVPSGTPVRRPQGQQKVGDEVLFGPTRELDFELELGFFVGRASRLGEPVPIGSVEDYMLGLVLVNDWSARDVQRWEYQPLGPFLAKSFATSISPWMVFVDALAPFAEPPMAQEPAPLPYLQPAGNRFDIHLEVSLRTAAMSKPQLICRSNAKHLYWTFAQQLAHQTSNGTPLEVGDLYASGTISGDQPGTFGSLLELSWKGTQPLTMEETGETRTFLEDGDTLVMTGWAQGDGYRIGLGEVVGRVLPAAQT